MIIMLLYCHRLRYENSPFDKWIKIQDSLESKFCFNKVWMKKNYTYLYQRRTYLVLAFSTRENNILLHYQLPSKSKFLILLEPNFLSKHLPKIILQLLLCKISLGHKITVCFTSSANQFKNVIPSCYQDHTRGSHLDTSLQYSELFVKKKFFSYYYMDT